MATIVDEHLFSPPLSYIYPFTQREGAFFLAFFRHFPYNGLEVNVMWAVDQVKAAVAQESIPPLALWYGEERYLIQEALDVLKGHFLRRDPSGSGVERLSGREVSPEEIVERANTVSFFAEKLLIIDDIPYFQEEPFDLEPLYTYFANPNPQTCLLFIAEKVHKGRKFYKEISRQGMVIEFQVPPSSRAMEWQRWVQERARAYGKTMTPATAQFFLDWAGHQAGILDQEIAKLAVYTADRREITKEDILRLSPPMIETTVFNLLDAVAAKDTRLALHKLEEVLQLEDPLKVLTMITRQIRLLLGTVAVRRKGGNKGDCMRILEIRSPYEAQKIFDQSFKLSYSALSKALRLCLQANLALKSAVGDKGLILEMLVIDLCRDGDGKTG